MEKYEVYLFDWDGTSARTLEVWLTLVRDCFEEFGVRGLTDSEVASTFGGKDSDFVDLGIPKDRFSDFDNLLKSKAFEAIPKAPMYEGVQELWDDLKSQGKKLALITTNYKEVIENILDYHNVSDYFDLVVSADEVKATKPDPEGIELALNRFDANTSQAIMLGDSRHDIGAANNAGIHSVLYYPASHALFHDFETIKDLHPTYVISDWKELLENE